MSGINKVKLCGVVVSLCIIDYAEVNWVTDASLSLHYVVSSSSRKYFKVIYCFKLQILQGFCFCFRNPGGNAVSLDLFNKNKGFL